jgi:hypothetical protein
VVDVDEIDDAQSQFFCVTESTLRLPEAAESPVVLDHRPFDTAESVAP